MSAPPHLHQGGSEFASSIIGHTVDLGNKSLTCRDTAQTITHNNYFGCCAVESGSPDQDHSDRKSRYESLIKSLEFPQINARHDSIRRAHPGTCKWIPRSPEYLDWLDPNKIHEHHGFLWIKGKPGAGKSTLMKSLLSNARIKMKDNIILSFFFNARGELLERSIIGMYRSLLLQILKQMQPLIIDSKLVSTTDRIPDWSIEELRTMFEQTIEGLGDASVVVFIDALDECNESNIRSMLSSFKNLGDLNVGGGFRLQVCLASRHYPNITMSKKMELVLEHQEGHEQDIVSYIDNELEIGDSKLANEVRDDIKAKASGVFIWVVLMIGSLQQKYDQGRIHELKQTLQEISRDLHELYRDILTRDDLNKDELILCIQWVLFEGNPLEPEQLYFAIRLYTESNSMFTWDRHEIQEDVIRNFILSSSKGLIEIIGAKQDAKVQFMHESVRDFLLKDSGLKKIAIESGGTGNSQAEIHERLKECCFGYTRYYVAEHGASTIDSQH